MYISISFHIVNQHHMKSAVFSPQISTITLTPTGGFNLTFKVTFIYTYNFKRVFNICDPGAQKQS